MPVCAAAIGALATFYQDPESDETIQQSVFDPLDRQDANDRGLLVQALRRSAVRVPAQRLDYASNFMR